MLQSTWSNRKSIIKTSLWTLAKIGNLLIGIATIVATIIGWLAFKEYKATNRLTARSQLYATEQLIASRETGDAVYGNFYVDVPNNLPPKDYCRLLINILSGDDSLSEITTAQGLHDYIWSTDTWRMADTGKKKEQLQQLRKIYLHSETYLYHIHNAFDYKEEGIISDGEWDTWAGLISDIGANPIFLSAIHSAYEQGYMSKPFAEELKQRLIQDPKQKEVIGFFYPKLLEQAWVNNFSTYNNWP